jgi:hypothetical protein
MRLKSFPYKWTCLLGLIFLASILWSATLLDEPSFLLGILSFLGLFASLIVGIVLAVIERSKAAVYRVLINITLCFLIVPTIGLGDFLRARLFLMHLTRFQEATNLLIENEAAKLNRGDTLIVTRLPAGYSDLHVADKVLIDSKQKNITVRYISRDSSAIGHRGYLYRSDDDPAALTREFPWLTRIAPHWFFYSD